MLETLGTVLAAVTGIVAVSQIALRFVAGPNQEARALGVKCFDLFRECENDDIELARFRELDDELGVFQHRVRFRTKKLIKRLNILNEQAYSTSPLRLLPESNYTRTRERQMKLEGERWLACEQGQETANDLIRWTGALDRWTIGK